MSEPHQTLGMVLWSQLVASRLISSLMIAPAAFFLINSHTPQIQKRVTTQDRLKATAHRVLWSPTIRAAVIAGTPWLDVYCPGCGTSRAPPAGVCGHAGARTGPKSPVCCCVDTCFMDDNHLISLHSLAASAARASRSRSAAVTMMQSRRVFSPILSVGFLTPLL